MENNVSVLYVDDEEINLMLFRELFKNKYEVLTAESGIKALDILEKQSNIDVVISDMKMPLMNGLEFISKARQKFNAVLFFILTGYEISSEIEKALQDGLILKYFQKPFKRVEIDSEIQKHLARK
jgi:CheY-like chemotaxis protein